LKEGKREETSSEGGKKEGGEACSRTNLTISSPFGVCRANPVRDGRGKKGRLEKRREEGAMSYSEHVIDVFLKKLASRPQS